jgi:hypothetical protein
MSRHEIIIRTSAEHEDGDLEVNQLAKVCFDGLRERGHRLVAISITSGARATGMVDRLRAALMEACELYYADVPGAQDPRVAELLKLAEGG